jgi:Arc/MetJ-type ribon-helix-helix transcriptional regulator
VNVSLPKDLEEFVAKKTASGEFPNPDAVVAAGLRELQNKALDESEPEWLQPLSDGTCPPELKSLLLEAVNSPHHPMPADYFDQLRTRLRSSRVK